MSLRIALQAIGLLIVGYLLLVAFLAMGPIGWAVFGTMSVIGLVQVYRSRRRRARTTDDRPKFCANCGAELAYELDDSSADSSGFETNHCSSCGAPVPSPSETSPTVRRKNCPECGAPNDAEETTCNYCEATL